MSDPASAVHGESEAISDFETLLVSHTGGVTRIVLNRPHRKNAVNDQMWADLEVAVGAAARDDATRVVILTGAGDAFCSGADLSADRRPSHPYWRMGQVNAVATMLFDMPKPTIAQVNGDAMGAGCNLALMCDLVLAAEGSRFGELFVRRGMTIDFGGSWVLPRLVGLQKAKELCLTGDPIDAREAERIGLILRAVPGAALGAEVEELAGRISGGPPVAQAMIKRLLNAGAASSMEESLRTEALSQIISVASRDSREGFAAFREKRDARFTGGWDR